MTRPLLLTLGDPCGIGPEIAVRVAASEGGVLLVGDVGVVRRALGHAGLQRPVASIDGPRQVAAVPPGALAVWSPPGLPDGLAELPMGRIDARAGAAAARCIEAAARAVMAGEGAALVTAPLHKEALSAAGIGFTGHTELLQSLAAGPDGGVPPVRMMLANDELKVVLVTIHLSLRQAIERLDFESVLQTLRITHAQVRGRDGGAPRIAVAGLNPHAGEGGLFGDEEVRFIAPAVQAARDEGLDAHGPFAPDTVFMRARHAPPAHRGEFDVVVAMTHDHGLIPVKYLGVEQGVNVTLGLPFVRTSPDHGTAFDIAGRGVADPASLHAAVRAARDRLGL
jgi:4-hydroxythreonine-4-phosphate dehydrogenase